MSRLQKFTKNLASFRLITFDIVDTLLKVNRPPPQQYALTAAEFGATNIDMKKLSKCYSQEYKRMSSKYPIFGSKTPDMGWQKWWSSLVENTFRCAKVKIDKDQLVCLSNKLVEIYRTKCCWCHMAGGQDMLRKISKTGKHVGVISNADASLPKILYEMGISDKFEFVLTSYEAGFEKPHCKIFEMAQERYKLAPQQCLHIGNLHKKDYEGARKAGWYALLVNKDADKSLVEDKTHVYPNMEKLLDALETDDIIWNVEKETPCGKPPSKKRKFLW